MEAAGYSKALVNLYHTRGHTFMPDLWVVCEEKYGKKYLGSGCSCIEGWGGENDAL
jgi:hypothetical protein